MSYILQQRISDSTRRRTSSSLHPYLLAVPLRDIIQSANIRYTQTLNERRGQDIITNIANLGENKI